MTTTRQKRDRLKRAREGACPICGNGDIDKMELHNDECHCACFNCHAEWTLHYELKSVEVKE